MILLKYTIITTQYNITLGLCYPANRVTKESLDMIALCSAIVLV